MTSPMKWSICFFAAVVMVCASTAQQPNTGADQPASAPAQKSKSSKKKTSTSGTAQKTDEGKTQKSSPAAASGGAAQEAGLESVLAQMDAASSAFRSAEADLAQEDYEKVVDDHHTENGKIYFRRTSKGLQMAMDFMNSPDSKYVLLTDNKIRLYQTKIDQITEYAVGKNRSDVESMFALGFGGRGHDLLKSFDVKLAGAEMIDGVKVSKLELTPKTEGLRRYFSRIELWIDPSNDVSRQQQFWQPSGDYHLAHYSKIKLNQKIPDDVFKLKTTSHTKTITP